MPLWTITVCRLMGAAEYVYRADRGAVAGIGWAVQEIDGNDLSQILQALDTARQTKGKPSLIVANTVKGKGVSFMEDQVGWHGTAPNREQTEQALAELEAGTDGR